MNIKVKILKGITLLLCIPVLYVVTALILGSITIERSEPSPTTDKLIYLSTNGIHLDIVVPKENLNKTLFSEIKHNQTDRYFSIGWGDENFYLNTPTWGELTFNNAVKAIF